MSYEDEFDAEHDVEPADLTEQELPIIVRHPILGVTPAGRQNSASESPLISNWLGSAARRSRACGCVMPHRGTPQPPYRTVIRQKLTRIELYAPLFCMKKRDGRTLSRKTMEIISPNSQCALWRSWKRRSGIIRSFFEQQDIVDIHYVIQMLMSPNSIPH